MIDAAGPAAAKLQTLFERFGVSARDELDEATLSARTPPFSVAEGHPTERRGRAVPVLVAMGRQPHPVNARGGHERREL
jgi:hypothetical protein